MGLVCRRGLESFGHDCRQGAGHGRRRNLGHDLRRAQRSLTGGNFIGGSIGAPALQLGFQKGIPGFANGGSGLIPGSGPTDSRLFLARVTPGEAFAFGDDAVRGMGGGGHSFNFSIDARGAQQGVAQQLDQWGKLVLPGLIRKALNDPYAVG